MRVSIWCAQWWVRMALACAAALDDQRAYPVLDRVERALSDLRRPA